MTVVLKKGGIVDFQFEEISKTSLIFGGTSGKERKIWLRLGENSSPYIFSIGHGHELGTRDQRPT